MSTPGGLVPVEVKPEREDAEPRESHLLQVLAYCVLLEETRGKRPPYGLLRYKHDTFKVDYNQETRGYLLGVLDEMRETLGSDVKRTATTTGQVAAAGAPTQRSAMNCCGLTSSRRACL